MQRSFVIIGLGRFGEAVARVLQDEGQRVLALDHDMDRVNELAHEMDHVYRCDSTDIESLRLQNVQAYDVAIVAIGDNMEASVLTMLNLCKLGVRHIVCKAVSEEHGEILRAIGGRDADNKDRVRVVYPQKDMGVRVAHHLVSRHVRDYAEVLDESVGLIEYETPAEFVGQTLLELALGEQFEVTVIAIRRHRRTLVAPRAQERLHAGDVLVLIGPLTGIRRMEESV